MPAPELAPELAPTPAEAPSDDDAPNVVRESPASSGVDAALGDSITPSEAGDAVEGAAEAAEAEEAAAGAPAAAPAQGGGAADALVTASAGGRAVLKCKPRYDRSNGMLLALEVTEADGNEFTLERPVAAGDEDKHNYLWAFAEDKARQARKEKVAAHTLEEMRRHLALHDEAIASGGPLRNALARRERRGAADAPASASASAPATPAPEEAPGASVSVAGAGAGAGAPPPAGSGRSVAARIAANQQAQLDSGTAPDDASGCAQHTPLPQAVLEKIYSTWELEIEHELSDKHGNPYVPQESAAASKRRRTSQRGTLCGAFPHALIDTTRGLHSGGGQLVIGGCHDVILAATLKPRQARDAPLYPEAEIMRLIREATPAAEVETWGRYESSLFFRLSLVFEDGGEVVAVDGDPHFSFRAPLPDNKLLVPYECARGTGDYYEQAANGGRLQWQFGFNNGVSSYMLVPDNKAHRFALRIEPLNPYLAATNHCEPPPPDTFLKRSQPFLIKAVIGNDLHSNERFVRRKTPGVSEDQWPVETALASDVRRVPPISRFRK